ncbi:MAG: response regulator [Candidatus Omnitrophota bacterium]|nr:response regulator [Candidatus Omnitrophota bacterium]
MAKRKILIVDDEPDFLEVMRTRLEANDYEVTTAANGEEALSYVKNSKPDAVLLDVLMPGVDGLEVLKRIRKMDENLPVYIITAFSTDERFKAANKLGASGFIVKTDDLSKEVDNITSALDMSARFRKKGK